MPPCVSAGVARRALAPGAASALPGTSSTLHSAAGADNGSNRPPIDTVAGPNGDDGFCVSAVVSPIGSPGRACATFPILASFPKCMHCTCTLYSMSCQKHSLPPLPPPSLSSPATSVVAAAAGSRRTIARQGSASSTTHRGARVVMGSTVTGSTVTRGGKSAQPTM